jgi:tape measure domain-containing protein
MVAVTADVVELELRARNEAYLRNIANAERQFSRRMQLMSTAAEGMERRVTAAGSRMSLYLGRAIAAIGVAAAVKEARLLADTWTASANKLAAAGVEMDKVTSTQQRLADLARETRSEYASTADLYAKLTRATKDLGATEVQVARATETVNKAFKAGGASTQEQVSSILQLSQALGSGLLQGDELRSIRENAPLLARAIAKEFDTTVAGLKKLGAEGKLTSDRVFKAILIGSAEIDSSFAKTRGTIGEAFTALRTEAGRFLNEFDRATGATAGISGFVEKVATDFDLLAQAVTVSAAVVSSALGVRLARSMGQAAVQNNAFVQSLLSGKFAFDETAFAAKQQAGQVLRSARASADAAQLQKTASIQKVAALREEARAYQENIALAEAQRAVAARAASTGRGASGQFVSRADAGADRNQATRAIIANRRALASVSQQLAVAESALTAATNGYTAAATRVAIAERAMAAAMVTTSVVTRAASVAMRGLSVAMSFFGGPIGVAIIAVAGALTYFATEAAKAEVAGENAQSVLDDLESKADSTRLTVDQLNQKLRDNKTAADDSAKGARNAATAYDAAGAAAANAAEMIKYMTAAQRQSQLTKIDDALGDLDKAIGGFNPIGTNNEEAVANARKKVLKQFGVGGTAARFGSSDVFVQQARDAIAAGKATQTVKDAVQEYDNALAVLNDNAKRRAALTKARDVVFRGIDDPTLKRPDPATGNLVAPTVDSKGGGKGGRTRQEKDLDAMRAELDLQQRINEARAAGADELAQFLEDQADLVKLTKDLVEVGMSPEEADKEARARIQRIVDARELAKLEEERSDAEREAAKAREDEQERLEDLRRRNLYLEEQALQVQLEIARASGNSERVKELERQLDLLQRIREYEDLGGLSPAEAKTRGEKDQEDVDQAKISGNIRDAFKDGVRAALDGDLSSFLEDFWKNALIKGTDRAIDNLFDALENVFKNIDWSSIFGGGSSGSGGFGSAIGSAIASLFGGGRAGGGLMRPGRIYKVGENGPEYVSVDSVAKTIPNRSLQANGRGGTGSLNIQVINNTGVAASAKVERSSDGGAKISLQPMFDKGVEGAGQSGALKKALMSSPQVTRRA